MNSKFRRDLNHRHFFFMQEAMHRTLLIFLFSVILLQSTKAEDSLSSTKKPNKRLIVLGTSVNVAYIGSMVALSEIWYKDSPKSNFHFFNDNHEWLQMDKLGHFTASFHESVFGVKALEWAGVPHKKAVLIGSLAGFVYQTPIEYFDGRSAEYGASVGDIIANTTGSALCLGQYLLWDEIRIQPKFSFHRTSLAAQRTDNILGKGLSEELLKDYNGQTYWLSANIYSFLKNKETTKFPKWLNLAFGYGGHNMLYASTKQNKAEGITPYRQYYLSMDIDFSKVKTKKWVKVLLYPLNIIHIPLPALEYSENKLRFHPVYF